MDFQHRAGSKTGGGGVAGWSESNRDRKERLRTLALETIDLNKVRTYWSITRQYLTPKIHVVMYPTTVHLGLKALYLWAR